MSHAALAGLEFSAVNGQLRVWFDVLYEQPTPPEDAHAVPAGALIPLSVVQ